MIRFRRLEEQLPPRSPFDVAHPPVGELVLFRNANEPGYPLMVMDDVGNFRSPTEDDIMSIIIDLAARR
jgi:hypothetical protein